MTTYYKTLTLISFMVALASCKTANHSSSSLNDIGGSPRNVSKPFPVVYISDLEMVHKGECPSTSQVISRNCEGFKNVAPALAKVEYAVALKHAVFGSVQPVSEYSIQSIEQKLNRVTAKISDPSMTVEQKDDFQKQQEDLTDLLENIKKQQAQSEELRKVYESILSNLALGKDAIYDEGSKEYEWFLAPFANSKATAKAKVQVQDVKTTKPMSDQPKSPVSRNYSVGAAKRRSIQDELPKYYYLKLRCMITVPGIIWNSYEWGMVSDIISVADAKKQCNKTTTEKLIGTACEKNQADQEICELQDSEKIWAEMRQSFSRSSGADYSRSLPPEE